MTETVENSNELLVYALTYAKRGWRVLPLHNAKNGKCSCGQDDCRSAGKHPRIKKWQERATIDETQIRRWWTTWPDANIGIATGVESGVFVLDVDGAAGQKTLEQWKAQHDWGPVTLTARTGKGLHLYFRQDGRQLRNSVTKLGDGVDIRADGGCVAAPPSIHANGSSYGWQEPECPLADAPEWLLDAVLAGAPVSEPATDDVVANEEVIEKGGRNDYLHKVGCGLRGKGYEINEIAEELMRLNKQKCLPPLAGSEVCDIADSAAKYPPNAAVSKDSPLWWFKLNVNEWCCDQDILFMKDYQVGWYIWLLVECWKNGGVLPNDPVKLARFARAKSAAKFSKEMAAVMGAFEISDDHEHIVHTHLAAEWKKCQGTVLTKKKVATDAAADRKRNRGEKAA